jgi:type IV pilus assembly protein PilV
MLSVNIAARPPMMKTPRVAQRGVGLLDALIAMAILAFGLLALTRFQGRMTMQTTDVQNRAVALQFADQLMSMALVDPKNVSCYTLPAAGVCANATSRAGADAWKTDLVDNHALPGTVTATSELAGTRLKVVIGWTAKDGTDETGSQRQLTAETDVQ